MSKNNKRKVWVSLINRENVDSFSQIYYKRKISQLDIEKAIKSLASKYSEDELLGMEILDIEEELIKEIGVRLGKLPEESEIHLLYQRYIETGSIEDPITQDMMEEDDDEDYSDDEGIQGIEIDDSNENNKKLKVKIKLNDLPGIFGQLFGFPPEDDQKKKDDKDSESFYI